MPTREQWTQLRELDRLYLKAKGTYRERYFAEQIQLLRRKMRLPEWKPEARVEQPAQTNDLFGG